MGTFLVIGLGVIAFFLVGGATLRSCFLDRPPESMPEPTAVPAKVALATFTPSPKATLAAKSAVSETKPATTKRLVDLVQPNRVPLGSDFQTKVPFLALMMIVLWFVEAKTEGWHWAANFWIPLAILVVFMASPILPWGKTVWVIGPKANPYEFYIQSIGVLVGSILLSSWAYGFRAPDKTTLAITFGLPPLLSTIPFIGTKVGLGALGLSLGLPKTAALIPFSGALETLGKTDSFTAGALTLVVVAMGVTCYVLLFGELKKWPIIQGVTILAQIAFIGIRFWWGVDFYLLWFLGMAILAVISSFMPDRRAWLENIRQGNIQLPQVSDALIVYSFGIWLFGIILGFV